MRAIEGLSSRPTMLPGVVLLRTPEVQAHVAREVRERWSGQLPLEGVREPLDVERIVAALCDEVANGTIDVPRVLVVPIGRVESGFSAFTLDLSAVRYPPVSADLWVQHLRTQEHQVLTLGNGGVKERRLEDYVVRGLVDFDDISYDEQADLLYDLAGQALRHFLSYLSEEDTRRVLQFNQHALAAFIHAQMQEHYWEKAEGYEVTVSHGFTPLKPSAYTAGASDAVQDYRSEPRDKTKIGQLLFGGFARCLYRLQKFDSDTERRFAGILEHEALRWFKPAKAQFQIFYRVGSSHQQYVPDFVAETPTELLMVETKARNELKTVEVEAKRKAAEEWCQQASAHAATYRGKPWRYVLVPHDMVADNMTLSRLTGVSPS
jgi:type III restriction enzyme